MQNAWMLGAVAAGGALGAVARYGLSGWIQQLSGSPYPWGTWLVNVLGSLWLGLAVRLLEGLPADPLWRGFLAVGLAGGFTTFSTFSYEALLLLREGELAAGVMYVAASVLVALTAVLVGFLVAGWILHWRG